MNGSMKECDIASYNGTDDILLSAGDTMDMHANGKREWTYGSALAEAEKYTKLKDFRELSSRAYRASCRNGWLKDYSWLEREGCGKWSYDKCYQESTKYAYMPDFRHFSRSAYKKARKMGWLADYKWLIDYSDATCEGHLYWTRERCFIEAKRFTTLRAFREESPAAYQIAARNNWISGYEWIRSERMYYLTFNRCYKAAKKYSSVDDFAAGSPEAYGKAVREKWINEYEWLSPSI